MVRLRYSHDRLKEVARDLGFDAVRLLHTHAQDDPIFPWVLGDCARLCAIIWAMFDLFGILFCLLYFCT